MTRPPFPLLDALPSPIAVVDEGGQVIAVNAAWRTHADQHQLPLEQEAVGRAYLDLWSDDQAFAGEMVHRVRQGFADVLAGRLEEFKLEYPRIIQDERYWHLLRLARFDESATPSVLAVHADISERKRAEAYSAIQHTVLNLVVAGMPLSTTLEHLARLIETEAQDATCVIRIYDPEEETLRIVAAPSLPEGYAQAVEVLPLSDWANVRARTADKGYEGGMVDLATDPGAAAYREQALEHGLRTCWSTPVNSQRGTLVGSLALYYRQTVRASEADRQLVGLAAPLAGIAIERHRAARRILENEQRYRSVFTLHPDAVFTLNRRGHFQSANPACEQLVGAAAVELKNTSFLPLLSEEYRRESVDRFRRAVAGIPQRFQTAIAHRSGRRVDVDVTLVPLMIDDGVAGVYAVAKDVTEQLQAESRLATSGRQLRQSQKMEAIGRLAGGIAHDFNNLLTAIRGYTDLLLADPSIHGAPRDDLEEIVKATSRAATLTRQLLTFSRQQVIQTKRLDLDAVVEDCKNMLARLVGAEIDLQMLPSSEPAWVEADPTQMEQVIINLVVNAHDAMPQGGRLTLETRVLDLGPGTLELLTPLPPGRWVALTVADTGRGMDKEVQSHIFEPFFTTKPPGQGTGLGLSTVYGIVEQSGGHIGFHSAVDHGTTFTIYLPARSAGLAGVDGAAEKGRVAVGSETILLVEDEESVRQMIQKILASSGYTILEARHGSDALLISREHQGHIDLLLTDVVMPELNGPQLAEALSTPRPEMRVMFMSGYTRNEVDRRGLANSGIAFLHKPFTVSELTLLVREVLDRPAPVGR